MKIKGALPELHSRLSYTADGSFSLSLKGGLILSSFRVMLEGEEPFSIKKKEECIDVYYADETRAGYCPCLRR